MRNALQTARERIEQFYREQAHNGTRADLEMKLEIVLISPPDFTGRNF